MNEHEQASFSNSSAVKSTHSPWLAVAAAGAALALGVSFYEGAQTNALRHQIVASQQDNQDLRAKLERSESEVRDGLASLHQELAETKQEATVGVAKAGQTAVRHADLLAQKQKEQAKQISDELGKVKETTNQAAARLDGISTDVGSVKTEVSSVKTDVSAVRTDVDSAKSNIEEAKTELQRMRGDMGVMSGLVATNGKEIQMLRDLGDRNIYEFTLSRTAGAQKVGDIKVELRKVDVKKNRYTVDVMADDKHVEKRDKTTNEPVQFYTSSARQPYELVVNQVKKDQIVGYLATPKVKVSRVTSAEAVSPAR